ncbi:MAG: transcription antitermination factor NusB [Hyphomicrobium sp.]
MAAGLAARELAVTALAAVLDRGRALDDAFDAAAASPRLGGMEPRDRGLALLIVRTVLRRRGELGAVVSSFLEKPLPKDTGVLWPILLSAAAQLLVLETPPHAAISLAVDQCRADRGASRFGKLANAVLRRVATQGADVLGKLDDPAALNVPAWLLSRWSKTYGENSSREIAAASLSEAPLDISVKSHPELWATTLGGVALPSGTVRLTSAGRIEELPGFADGAWWVQDAAAALPARLLGDVAGRDVADLCSAPGGKTAQLAATGARVTAVDLSANRLRRVEENLARLKLTAEIVTADAATWDPDRQFDAILLDAPCTATGTIRRHPDIVHLKREPDVAQLAALQSQLLDRAAHLTKPGGLLVYCTCSLEPEEGIDQVTQFLLRHSNFERVPLRSGEVGLEASWVTPLGDLRTLPTHAMDGFYAARLRRKS